MNDTSGIDLINQVSRSAQIMAAVQPIFDQINIGMGEKEIPEGGIFDPHIRGYIFGFINKLIEIKGGGGIDKNPHAASEIFNVMFSSPYEDDNEGSSMFNECLQDRNKAEENGGNTNFDHGFSEGESDYVLFISGTTPFNLSNYVDKVLS